MSVPPPASTRISPWALAGLVVVSVLAANSLGPVISRLLPNNPPVQPPAQTAAAPVEPSGPPAGSKPRLGPNPLVVRGEKGWDGRVIYDTVPLVIWPGAIPAETPQVTAVPTATQTVSGTLGITTTLGITPTLGVQPPAADKAAAAGPLPTPWVYWLPPASAQGAGQLTLKDDAGAYCNGLPSGPITAICYSVGMISNTLPTGVYSTTVFVRYAEGKDEPVTFNLRVGRPLSDLIGLVAAGMLAVQLLSWLGSGVRRRWSWQSQRSDWLDWLSEDLHWLRPFTENEKGEVEQAALEAARKSLQDTLGAQEQKLLAAKALSDLPVGRPEAEAALLPARSNARRLLKRPAQFIREVEALQVALGDLGGLATAAAQADFDKARLHIELIFASTNAGDPGKALQSAYNALDILWTTNPPGEPPLATAWLVIKAVWERYIVLRQQAGGLPTPNGTAAGLNAALAPLQALLTALDVEVIKPSSAQLAALLAVPAQTNGAPAQGKNESLAFLQTIAWLAGLHAAAVLDSQRAAAPYQYAPGAAAASDQSPAGRLGLKLAAVKGLLPGLAERVAALTLEDLTTEAVGELLLNPVRKALVEAEAGLDGDPDESQLKKLINQHARQRSWVRMGRRVHAEVQRWRRLSEALRESEPGRAALEHLRSAYLSLLEGRRLDAEIELQRARSELVLATNPQAELQAAAGWLNQALSRLSGTFHIQDWLSRRLGRIGRAAQPPLVVVDETPAEALERQPAPAPAPLAWLAALLLALLIGGCLLLRVWIWYDDALRAAGGPNPVQPGPVLNPLEGWVVTILAVAAAWLALWPWIRRWALALGRSQLYASLASYTPLALTELFENLQPNLAGLLAWLGVNVLSLAIAAALILFLQQTVLDALDTWGSALDIAAAFAWGALAHQGVTAVIKAWPGLEKISSGLGGSSAS